MNKNSNKLYLLALSILLIFFNIASSQSHEDNEKPSLEDLDPGISYSSSEFNKDSYQDLYDLLKNSHEIVLEEQIVTFQINDDVHILPIKNGSEKEEGRILLKNVEVSTRNSSLSYKGENSDGEKATFRIQKYDEETLVVTYVVGQYLNMQIGKLRKK